MVGTRRQSFCQRSDHEAFWCQKGPLSSKRGNADLREGISFAIAVDASVTADSDRGVQVVLHL